MPTRSCRQVGPPPNHDGAGEGDAEGAVHPPGLQHHVQHGTEVPLPPIGPGRHLLGRGRIRLPGGQGDPVQGAGRCGRHPTRRGTAWAPPPRTPHASWRCWPRCLPNVQSAATPHCANCRPRSAAVHHRCLRAGRHRGLQGARRAPRAIAAGACNCAWCGAEYPATKR